MIDIDELSPRRSIALGLVASAVCLLGLLGWGANAAITSAIVAMGEVDASPHRHPVQHPSGGVIAAVLAREGQRVEAGQVLLRLDSTEIETERALVAEQLVEARARLLRLGAERDDAPFPALPLDQLRDRPFVAAMGAQLRLFDARRERLERQLAQLLQRRRQAEAELGGLIRQRDALGTEAEILAAEFASQQALRQQGLTRSGQVSALAREIARVSGQRAALEARDAELRGQITEIRLQSAALHAAQREEAEQQFAETSRAVLELSARARALDARIEALALRAPASGVVHDLRVNGIEAVLRPAQEAMQILTIAERPALTLRVRPDDIDHIDVGQAARVRFPALEAHDLPELPAYVANVSAATFIDERSGARHFRVELALTDDAMPILGDRLLVPGMSVQGFITTGQRTPLGYLVAPIRDHFARALREP